MAEKVAGIDIIGEIMDPSAPYCCELYDETEWAHKKYLKVYNGSYNQPPMLT